MSKWQTGQSGNLKGRPKGSGEAGHIRALLSPHAPDLIQKALNLAYEGNPVALRLCLERILPPIKPSASPVQIPALTTALTLSEKAIVIVDAVGCGDINPDDASTIIGILGKAARVKEVDELETRVAQLEERLNEKTV